MANPLELISGNATEKQSVEPEVTNGLPTESFWNKNGYSRDYDIGKLYGNMGNVNDGNLSEFLIKFSNLLIVLINKYSKDNKNENTVYTEVFDIFRSSLMTMVLMSGMKPTVQNNARFLASMQGFFDGYLKNTGITGRL